VTVIRLPEHVVNRIAAGEVIERPASVVKELVENAIDAGATRIDIVTANGGKNLIRITDNGSGMSRDDLALAVERHCTSKLAEDLLDIRTLGFRGEALPSIGAVSRLTVTSRDARDPQAGAWCVSLVAGKQSPPRPAALSQGTVVEVEDLFFATPARLKFLKSDKAEAAAIGEIVKRIAIAFPHVRFSLSGTDRTPLDLSASDLAGRLAQVLGDDFVASALAIDALREGVRLTGLAGLPAYNKGNGLAQYFYVNGRPVRDKVLAGALRGAYADFLARDRHPVAALFIEIEPHAVDVNVHPAKADVRFRDSGLVRGLLVGALRQAIASAGGAGSSERGSALAGAFSSGMQRGPSTHYDWRQSPYAPPVVRATGFEERQAVFESAGLSGNVITAMPEADEDDHPLGAARAQLHKNYIIAQTRTGLVIVDQHAAHERIVYEALKAGMESGVPSQLLLIPEIVELPQEDVAGLLEHEQAFRALGLAFESFGPGAIAVRETPSMLGEVDVQALMRDLADEIAQWDGTDGLQARLAAVASRMACHGSVRSGRILKPDEMNALLRTIEATPNSGVCNHGRPTFIELKLKDIERLFGR
jgi:DNA mismatch repair protein MutL